MLPADHIRDNLRVRVIFPVVHQQQWRHQLSAIVFFPTGRVSLFLQLGVPIVYKQRRREISAVYLLRMPLVTVWASSRQSYTLSCHVSVPCLLMQMREDGTHVVLLPV